MLCRGDSLDRQFASHECGHREGCRFLGDGFLLTLVATQADAKNHKRRSQASSIGYLHRNSSMSCGDMPDGALTRD